MEGAGAVQAFVFLQLDKRRRLFVFIRKSDSDKDACVSERRGKCVRLPGEREREKNALFM